MEKVSSSFPRNFEGKKRPNDSVFEKLNGENSELTGLYAANKDQAPKDENSIGGGMTGLPRVRWACRQGR